MTGNSGWHGLLARGAPPMPAFTTIISYVTIGLSVAALIGAAVALSAFGGYYYAGDSGPAGFIIFDVSHLLSTITYTAISHAGVLSVCD